LLALGACQAVFGLDETEPPSSSAGAGAPGGSAAASSDSTGATGATGSSTGGGGTAGNASGGGGPGGGGSGATVGCGPDQMGEELLGYGDMESGVGSGDGSWDVFEATLEEETSIVQAGQKAGLLCATTANQDYFSAYIDVLEAGTIAVGQRYVGSACVRSHPAHLVPQYAMVRLREQGGNQQPIDTESAGAPVGDQFTRIVTPEMVVTDPDNTKVSFHVLGWDMADDVCLVFDSAHVVRLPPE